MFKTAIIRLVVYNILTYLNVIRNDYFYKKIYTERIGN